MILYQVMSDGEREAARSLALVEPAYRINLGRDAEGRERIFGALRFTDDPSQACAESLKIDLCEEWLAFCRKKYRVGQDFLFPAVAANALAVR